MCRIFNVLLIMLLHPDTARESVQQLPDDSSPEIHYRFAMTFSLSSLVGYSREDDDDEDDQVIGEGDAEQDSTAKRKRVILSMERN